MYHMYRCTPCLQDLAAYWKFNDPELNGIYRYQQCLEHLSGGTAASSRSAKGASRETGSLPQAWPAAHSAARSLQPWCVACSCRETLVARDSSGRGNDIHLITLPAASMQTIEQVQFKRCLGSAGPLAIQHMPRLRKAFFEGAGASV